MHKDVRLTEEEIIFSSDNIIQNIKFLQRDLDEGLDPKVYEVDVNNEVIKVIVLHNLTVTHLVASFRNRVSFRLILNLEENIVLVSPSANSDLLKDDIALEDYVNKIASNIFSNKDSIGSYGSKTASGVRDFQLWNFYNYKIYLDI